MIQTGSLTLSTSGKSAQDEFVIGFLSVSFVFYVAAIYLSFQGYKEYKAMD